MKKFIIAIVAVVMTAIANTNANAMTEAEVADYIRTTVEGATNVDARLCADAWAHGGYFKAEMTRSTLECGKQYISEEWDLSKR